MNRRRKKKQQVDYVESVKQKFAAIDWKQLFDKERWLEHIQPITLFWLRLPKFHQRALMILVPLILILFIVPLPNKTQSSDEQTEVEQQRVMIDVDAQSLSQQSISQVSGSKSEGWKEYTVKTGDTLAQVFRRNHLSMADLSALVRIEGSDKPLSQIKQGQLIRFKLSKEGKLDMLQLERSGRSVMFFRLSDGSFGRNK